MLPRKSPSSRNPAMPATINQTRRAGESGSHSGMLDYRLKVFRAVAEQRNFTRAAESLHISQPAVTQHVKLLEEHYGTALLHRTPQGVELTPAGAIVLAAAAAVADIERATAAQVRAGQKLLVGPLRVAASTTVAQYFLPAAIARFQAEHPRVELTLRVANTREVTDGVRAGRFELGVIEGPAERPDVRTQAFFVDEIVCVGSPRTDLARRKEIRATDLAQAVFILRELGSGTREIVEQALRRAKVPVSRLRVQLEAESSEAIKRLVAAGPAVAFLSRLAIANEVRSGELKIIPVRGLTIKRDFSFVFPQGPGAIGPAAAFVATVSEQARVSASATAS